MSTKEFKKLNKAELLEVIYRMQLRDQEMSRELEMWKTRADERYDKLENSGSIAEAAISIHDVFAQAQKAADDYVSTVSARAEQRERKAQEAVERLNRIVCSMLEFLEELEEDGFALYIFRAKLGQVMEELSEYMPRSDGEGEA